MVRYFLTNKAVDDLAEIWNYTYKKWSEKQADKYYKSLISDCSEIAKNPRIGKTYNGISPSLKGLQSAKHIIFYRAISSAEIEITRILHERMDLKHRISE